MESLKDTFSYFMLFVRKPLRPKPCDKKSRTDHVNSSENTCYRCVIVFYGGTLNSDGIDNRSAVFSKGFGAVKLSRKSIKVIVGVNILVLILYTVPQNITASKRTTSYWALQTSSLVHNKRLVTCSRSR